MFTGMDFDEVRVLHKLLNSTQTLLEDTEPDLSLGGTALIIICRSLGPHGF